ncbi:MAG: hypothetical protein MZV70_58545 [Desulfobacterales bacterium]|nr:hypothetical protein [Desulfobacterales bacterium]
MVIASIWHRSRHISQPVQFSSFIADLVIGKNEFCRFGKFFHRSKNSTAVAAAIAHSARVLGRGRLGYKPRVLRFSQYADSFFNVYQVFPNCFLYKTAPWIRT